MERTPDLPANFPLIALGDVGSTNDEARRLAAEGAPDGTVVWARSQNAGRGRYGRSWSSPPGNLYVSLLLRPACPPATALQLGFVAAVALGEALDRRVAAAALTFKWPNDVLLDGRKIAGILLEFGDRRRRRARLADHRPGRQSPELPGRHRLPGDQSRQ